MSCNMTSNIYCNGKTCNVSRILFHVYLERGGRSSKTLYSYTKLVNSIKCIYFYLLVKIVRIVRIKRSCKSFF